MQRLIVLALLAATGAAQAQESGRLLAIQQKKFSLVHELDVGGMFEPQDAFSKGLALEGAYTWHFGDDLSWEVVRGGYIKQLDSGLKAQLINQFGVAPTAIELLEYYVSSSLMWSPLYGKFALRNASVVHAEAFVTAGGALGHFTSSFREGPELGVGVRVFLSQRLSMRFDARDAVFLHKETDGSLVKQVIFLSIGLSISLGGNGG
jgi:outer membrane beta-barrel protein